MTAAGSAWWRHVALAGAVAGLILAPAAEHSHAALAIVIASVAGVVLALTRPGGAGSDPAGALPWLALVAAAGAGAGLGLGGLRVAAIERSAATGKPRRADRDRRLRRRAAAGRRR